jgi:hypothetical protein
MGYTKLAAGVVLGIAGLFATIGAVGGWISYATTCVGVPSGSVAAYTCGHPSAVVCAVEWTILSGVLWVSTVAAIRSRGAQPTAIEPSIAPEATGL